MEFESLNTYIEQTTTQPRPEETRPDFGEDGEALRKYDPTEGEGGDHFRDDPLGERPRVNEPEPDPVMTGEGLAILFDTLQTMGFSWANQKKLRKRFFISKDQFLKASKLAYEPDEDLRNREDEEEGANLVALKRRYQDYIKIFKEKTENIPWREDEKIMIQRPLQKLSEQQNFDLPPGWALVFSLMSVSIPRFSQLLTD